ncbi:MAG: RecX family transcriptional regulator [Bacteroidales bacterium]|nr:RecX family transcriptional regulator [Bacteroidales bacterium]
MAPGHEFLLAKMQNYCSYQERSFFDVKSKLINWNVQEKVIDEIINELVKDNYLDEERYAKAYAGGKFRISKWGKNKIINELNKKQIPDIYIQIGLQEIDDVEYFNTLKEVISKKDATLNVSDPEKRMNRLANYAVSKGYSRGIVWKVLNQTI